MGAIIGGAMDGSAIIQFATALFAITAPFAMVVSFATMTQHLRVDLQWRVAKRAVATMAITLAVCIVAGRYVLSALGISVAMLQAISAVVLLRSALDLVDGHLPSSREPGESEDPVVPKDWKTFAIVPMGIPVTIGGGVIALVITQASFFPALRDQAIIGGICAVLVAGVLVAYRFAGRVAAALGETGIAVLTRLFGLVLGALAFGLLATGLNQLFPGLSEITPLPSG